MLELPVDRSLDTRLQGLFMIAMLGVSVPWALSVAFTDFEIIT